MAFLVLPDLNNLIVNENAYFFKLQRPLSKAAVDRIFTEALTDKKSAKRVYKSVIRDPVFDGQQAVGKFSLEIFEFKTKPTFLKLPEPGKWETKFGFLLILEFKDYLAVIRKNVSGIKTLMSMVEKIDYSVLAYFLTTDKSKFEKLVSNNMNTAENAIQTKFSEAKDLKGVVSRFGASKQIPTNIRIDNSGVKNAIALNTSRVNSFKLDGAFNPTLLWLVQMLRLIDRAYTKRPSNNFLDGFAKPIQFETIIDQLEPTYLVLRFGNLKSDIEQGLIDRCFKIDATTQKEVTFDLASFVDGYERLFPLTKIDDKAYNHADLDVRINKKSITFSSNEFKQIYLDQGGNITNLNQYMVFGNHYMVNFDKIDHVYSHGKIFQDSKLLGDTENFLETFVPYTELETITSEKGDGYTTTSTVFNSNSLFNFIETKLCSTSQCLICDDLGVEWGDYISIDKDSIAFFHAKSNVGNITASKLQDVFGQAQKNFGFLELTDDMIDQKSRHWAGFYTTNKVTTKISRIRRCPTGSNQIQTIKNLVAHVSSNANFRRKVYVVINYISKKELTKSIADLKGGNQFANAGVAVQVLWLVNSLLCSAYELNTELKIICKP